MENLVLTFLSTQIQCFITATLKVAPRLIYFDVSNQAFSFKVVFFVSFSLTSSKVRVFFVSFFAVFI